MEDRNNIRFRAGIQNARKLASAGVEDSETQTVTVYDGFGEVCLAIQSSSFPAGLTPDQARLLAEQIIASANRVGAT